MRAMELVPLLNQLMMSQVLAVASLSLMREVFLLDEGPSVKTLPIPQAQTPE